MEELQETIVDILMESRRLHNVSILVVEEVVRQTLSWLACGGVWAGTPAEHLDGAFKPCNHCGCEVHQYDLRKGDLCPDCYRRTES